MTKRRLQHITGQVSEGQELCERGTLSTQGLSAAAPGCPHGAVDASDACHTDRLTSNKEDKTWCTDV